MLIWSAALPSPASAAPTAAPTAAPAAAGVGEDPALPPRALAQPLSAWQEGQARALWAAMTADRAWAGPTLSRGLRETRALGSKDRRLVGDVLLAFVRHEAALARLDPEPFAAWRRLCAEGIPALPDPEDPDEALSTALSLPRWLAAEWRAELGLDGALRLARTLAGRAPVALRWLRGPVELPVPHRVTGPATVVLDAPVNLDTVPAFREGRCFVQDLGSQELVAWADLGPGARVLDLCAGAGGKSLALAALGAEVWASDMRPDALEELRRRAARARLPIRTGPPEGRYDLVLVDAPCSGTGVLRRHPETRWRLRFPHDAQRRLLEQALGRADRVVYATCALTRGEDEELVRSVAPPVEEARLWPEPGGRDGFYVARLGAGWPTPPR